MPKRARFEIRQETTRAGYVLVDSETENILFTIKENETEWLQWLEEHHSLTYIGPSGRLNLLKETRPRAKEGFWYAYQRLANHRIKHYIGRHLILAKLEIIASTSPANQDEATPSSPLASENHHTQANRQRSSRQLAVGDKNPAGQVARKASVGDKNPDGPSEQGQRETWDGTMLGRGVFEEKADQPEQPSAHQEHPEEEGSLLLGRLQRPRPQSDLIPRPRLFELLEQGQERKLTMIAGPAGFGKTTLVAQWLHAREQAGEALAVGWLDIDEQDNDPARFWRYIIAACDAFQAGLDGEELAHLLATDISRAKKLELLLVSLLNSLSRLKQPALLVLDNVHLLHNRQTLASLTYFLEHLPPLMHVIIMLRGDATLALSHLRARNEMLDIYPPVLAFSPDEIRAFVSQHGKFPVTPHLLRLIQERIENWPAGLRLFLWAANWSKTEQEAEQMLSTFTSPKWNLWEYIHQEVYEKLTPELRTLVLETSGFPLLRSDFCAAVLERPESARALDQLRVQDVFLIPVMRDTGWLRYHQLFAEVMQKEAEQQLGARRLADLALRASHWYEAEGLQGEAIVSALHARAYPRAAELLKRYLGQMAYKILPAHHEWYAIHRWLERLPSEELEQHADLCVFAATTLLFMAMGGSAPEGLEERVQYLLQVAERLWERARADKKLAEIYAFRAMLAHQEGEIMAAMAWARKALEGLPAEERTWQTIARTTLGMGELSGGNLARASEYLLTAQALGEEQGNIIYTRAIRGTLAGVRLEEGERLHAAESFRQLLSEARAGEDNDDIGHMQLALASQAYEENRLEDAWQMAQEALLIGEQTQAEDFQVLAHVTLARVEQARGFSELALHRLRAWLARSPAPTSAQSFSLLRRVQMELARLQLAEGDLAAVQRWANGLRDGVERLPGSQRMQERLLYARWLLALGKVDESEHILSRLATIAEQSGRLHVLYSIRLAVIEARLRAGQEQAARDLLVLLLAATQSQGYTRLYLDAGELIRDLLIRLLPELQKVNRGQDRSGLYGYVRRILQADSAQEPTPPGTPPGLLEPLSPQEERVLRLLAEGQSNSEIARTLVVSVNTVRSQVQSIYRKLDVRNRVEATALAREIGLVE